MGQKFVSPPTNELEWLQESYDKRKNRSLELGIKAIEILVKEGKLISYRTVSDKSKEIDPDGIGIHQNTIRITAGGTLRSWRLGSGRSC